MEHWTLILSAATSLWTLNDIIIDPQKIDENKTIRVFDENNSVSLTLDDEKSKVTVIIDNDKI